MSECLSSTLEHRGCQFAYEVRGTGDPVLMIQGVGVHGAGWRPQVDSLSPTYRCLTFDNRGLNRSQPLGVSLSVEQMAEDAIALMDTQGWKSAHVVGHSLGGLVAQQIGLSARSRVRSLSLLCTFSRGRDATQLSPWMIWTGLRTRLGTRRQRRRAFLEMVLSPEAYISADLDKVAEEFAVLFGHDLASQPPVVMKQMGALVRYDATPRLSELNGLPVLVISAAHDRIARPASGRAIASGVSGAHYLEIADGSHGATIERAEQINAALQEHFQDCRSAGQNRAQVG